MYPFWALRGNGLWQVGEVEELALTSGGRRPTLSTLNETDPLAGLPEGDFKLLTEDTGLAARIAGSVLLRFFDQLPAGLLTALGLEELLAGRIDTSLWPRVGEPFTNRDTIADACGGNRVLGITPLADGILTVYSDDKGPYADKRIEGTDFIAYTGDGLSGDQQLRGGNKSMQRYQAEQRALRYWHKPHQGQWTFETWAVIIECHRRWGRGEDGKMRREFAWVLAPVASPLRHTWPEHVLDALAEDDGLVHDHTANTPSAKRTKLRPSATSIGTGDSPLPPTGRPRAGRIGHAGLKSTATSARPQRVKQSSSAAGVHARTPPA